MPRMFVFKLSVPITLFLGAALMLGIVLSPVPASAIDCSTPDAKTQCQQEYDKLQEEIANWQKILTETQAKKNTLSGDVTLLTAQIKQAQAQIKAKNIAIANLGTQIAQKTSYISQLEARIGRGKDSLASFIRQQNQIDDISLPEVAFGTEGVGDLFEDVDHIAAIEQGLKITFAQIRGDKSITESQRAQLTDQQNKQVDAKYEVQTKEQQINQNKQEKTTLLAITKNQESQYQKVLADRQAKAAAIRAALFPLRDAAAIQFGDALTYAEQAQKTTGVDPALVLAVLTQESNLGANVGQCYLTNDTTGAGVGKNSGTAFSNVMSPTRDVPPFLALANKLGFDPHHQVVSCPIASAGGWGGAMGPAQFIASTWAGLAGRVSAVLGTDANPWQPRDAITAMSLFLGDLGASSGGYSSEHMAAAKYYAGGYWATSGKAYADQVMARVASIQKNIDFLKDN